MVDTLPSRYHDSMDTQPLTIRLPGDVYEKLRREAFDTRGSMNAIITGMLEQRYAPAAEDQP